MGRVFLFPLVICAVAFLLLLLPAASLVAKPLPAIGSAVNTNTNSNSNSNSRLNRNRLVTVLAASRGGGSSNNKEPVVIESDYKVAAGFGVLSFLLLPVLPFASLPVGALAALLARQTGRVRFTFDDEAMEVFIQNKDGSFGSRENFAVGGRNRWSYKSFLKWSFIPSKELPIFMYFTESQTDPKKEGGQFHLFPVIMNSDQLYQQLIQRVGEK